jgi:hypothetical protein
MTGETIEGKHSFHCYQSIIQVSAKRLNDWIEKRGNGAGLQMGVRRTEELSTTFS